MSSCYCFYYYVNNGIVGKQFSYIWARIFYHFNNVLCVLLTVQNIYRWEHKDQMPGPNSCQDGKMSYWNISGKNENAQCLIYNLSSANKQTITKKRSALLGTKRFNNYIVIKYCMYHIFKKMIVWYFLLLNSRGQGPEGTYYSTLL